MNVTVRPFEPSDLDGFEFRDAEEEEARRGDHSGCAEVVLLASQETPVFTAVGRGGPFLFFGRNVKEEDEGSAYVWMLGHKDRLYLNKVGLVRGLSRKLDEWSATTPLQYTYMNPASTDHIRILRAFGFVALRWIAYNGDQSTPYLEMVRLRHGH